MLLWMTWCGLLSLCPNRAPVFSERDYSYTLTSTSHGSVTPVVVGTPAAEDPENQALVYSLRASDLVEGMYMVGGSADVLYTLDSITGRAVRVGTTAGFRGF